MDATFQELYVIEYPVIFGGFKFLSICWFWLCYMLLLEGSEIFQKNVEDNENVLYTTTLFQKVADFFKTSAQKKGL